MEIRETTPADYDDFIALVLAEAPQFNAALVEGPVRDPSQSSARWLLSAVEDGVLVGAGIQAQFLATPPERLTQVVTVAKKHAGRGIGGELHRRLDALMPTQAGHLMSSLDDRDERSLQIAMHWGYEALQHSITSCLDLVDLPDPELGPGLTIQSSPDLVFDDEDAVEAMHDSSQTNPEREYDGPTTLAMVRPQIAGTSGERGVALVMRLDGRPIAISYGLVLDGLGQIIYTGVDAQARGHGHALVLKQAMHRALAAEGATYVLTNNEENNAGIRRVNERLGYLKDSGIIWIRRDL